MSEVIRLLQVKKNQMLKQAQEEFAGATSLMEWMVRHSSIPLRKAKMVVEKAVKYSDKEGKESVSYQSLKKALAEMKINIPIKEKDVEKMQRPERILDQTPSIGTPSERRVREHIASLRERIKINRDWLTRQKRKMDKARGLVAKMEKELVP
jgi:argininosuccinate lyase